MFHVQVSDRDGVSYIGQDGRIVTDKDKAASWPLSQAQTVRDKVLAMLHFRPMLFRPAPVVALQRLN